MRTLGRASLRRRFVLWLGIVFGADAADGEEERRYRIVDAAGKPVAGARVLVLGTPREATTGSDGEVRFAPPPTPPFQAAVFDRRGAWLGIVAVSAADAGEVLRLSAPAHEEVTVRGGRPTSVDAPPAAAVTVLSEQAIEDRQPLTLTDSLRSIPGVGNLDEGHTMVPSLRGLARGRTLILLDDARVTAERRAGPSATYLDPFALEAVEVVRGPGSVAYGSDAFGGVLHARTPVPDPAAAGGRFVLSSGTVDRSLAGLVESNVPLGPGALLVSARQRSFADYDSPSGTVENSAARDRGFLARGLLPLGTARIVFGYQADRGRDVKNP